MKTFFQTLLLSKKYKYRKYQKTNIFEKNQYWYQKAQNCMLISNLLEKLPKNTCKKSYEQNSQLKVHFLAFTCALF